VSDSSPRWRAELERLRATAGPFDRPFVTVSFAVSEDLCLSSSRGKPSRVSSDATLQVTHELRAVHDALLVGVGTVLSDDPALTTRLAPGRSPLRVVLDSRLSVPLSARVLRSTSEPALLMTTSLASAAREEQLRSAGAQIARVVPSASGVDLRAMLGALHARGVKSVMVEGGVAVLESFFTESLIDFLVVTVSPQRLENADAVRLGPVARSVLAGWEVPPEAMAVDRLLSGPLHPHRVAS
jgi:GTP cyclohydrolase II